MQRTNGGYDRLANHDAKTNRHRHCTVYWVWHTEGALIHGKRSQCVM